MTWTVKSTDSRYALPSLIGFDDLFEQIDSLTSNVPKYPPHEIIKPDKIDDGAQYYYANIAVAGFKREDISITEQDKVLHVKGNINQEDKPSRDTVLFGNLSRHKFHLKLKLSDKVVFENATLEDGILKIVMVETEPELNSKKYMIR